MVIPVANESAWVVVCTAATTADNSGSTVLDPSAITRSAQNWFLVNGTGTTLQVCLRYTPGAAGTSPVVQVFGRDVVGGSGAVYQRLKDASGNPATFGGVATQVFEKQPDGSLKLRLHTFN